MDYSIALENVTVCKLGRAVPENCQLPSYTLFSFVYPKAFHGGPSYTLLTKGWYFWCPEVRQPREEYSAPLENTPDPQLGQLSRGSYIALVLPSDSIKPKIPLSNCTTTPNLYFHPIQLPTSRGVGQKSDQESKKRTKLAKWNLLETSSYLDNPSWKFIWVKYTTPKDYTFHEIRSAPSSADTQNYGITGGKSLEHKQIWF